MKKPVPRPITVFAVDSGEEDDPCLAKARSAGEKPDCCRSAVVRAYRELKERDRPLPHAFEAALTVYRWHHPEVSAGRAFEIVTEWVADGTVH